MALGPTEVDPKSVDPQAAGGTALFMALLAGMLWLAMGFDSPLVALMVAFSTANLGIAAIPLAMRIPERWYRVPEAERLLHVLLGVPLFGWLLDRSGWNRHIALPMRDLRVTRSNLARLLTYIHAAEGAHAIAFLPHVALAAIAGAKGHTSGAWWILLPGVVLHLYPVLLQRWMTLRVSKLLAKSQLHS